MDIDDELPSVQDIYDNHEVIVESYDMKYTGIRAYFPENKIRSVLKEASRYEDEFKKAAVVLRELPNIHVFQDGNNGRHGSAL